MFYPGVNSRVLARGELNWEARQYNSLLRTDLVGLILNNKPSLKSFK